MQFRYLYGVFVGAITIISILLFGEKGVIALVLLAFRPAIMRLKKMNADEREQSLFHKTNSITLGVILILILAVFLIMGDKTKELFSYYWLTLFAGIVIFVQGLVGYLMLRLK